MFITNIMPSVISPDFPYLIPVVPLQPLPSARAVICYG